MDDGGGTGLPASIEAAWGLRARPAKGPKPGLSIERIVAAGVAVAAAEGGAAVSMHRVATELGTSAMSLYRYVASKGELLELMFDAAVGSPPCTKAPDEGWREGLSRWAWAQRDLFRRQPWILDVPISGPPITPNNVAWMEEGLRCLGGTGLDEGEKLGVILLLAGFVRNEARLAADLAAAALASGSTVEAAMAGYGRLLSRLVDPERFPAVTAAIASGVLDRADHPDADFTFGLERVLDGVDVLVRARSG
jgi:AcrR family transcriptional regulator